MFALTALKSRSPRPALSAALKAIWCAHSLRRSSRKSFAHLRLSLVRAVTALSSPPPRPRPAATPRQSATAAARLATLHVRVPRPGPAPVVATTQRSTTRRRRPGELPRASCDAPAYSVSQLLVRRCWPSLAGLRPKREVLQLQPSGEQLNELDMDAFLTRTMQGHISKDCPQPQRRACYNCQQEG